MNSRTIIRRGALAAVAAALLSASPAHAVLSEDSIDCRAAIAKNYAKLFKTANKTIAGCHKARDKDVALVATDCNVMAQADAAKGKYASSAAKAATAVTTACTGEPISTLTAANIGGEAGESELYISCVSMPCPGVTGVVDTAAELGACLGCAAAGIAEDVGAATLGLPNPANLDSDEQKCHGAIAKGYGKYLDTGLKTENTCQKEADSVDDYDTTGCVGSDPKSKVAGSLTKAGDGLTKSCPATVNLADLDGCAIDTLANVKACNGTEWGNAEDDAFSTTYVMPATGCPSTTRTTIRGGCSTQGSVPGGCSSGFETGTVLSVGWKGLAHGVDITDNYTVAADIICPGTVAGSCTTVGDSICAGGTLNGDPCTLDADCLGGGDCQGDCVSTGISADNPQYTSFTRCIDDPAIACTNPFANDPVCPSMGACKYFLGPPLAVSAGGTPTCTLNAVNADIIGGTGNPDLGAAEFTIDLRAVVHLGVSQSRPCPYCRNDPTPQDGNRAGGVCAGGSNDGTPCTDGGTCLGGGVCSGNFGTCFDGPHDGDPCDVQGFDLSFANPAAPDDAPNAGNSLDCPPTSGANISGSGLAILLPLTTGVSAKDATDPCESPNAGLDCYCGICSGDVTVSCNTDAECAGMGLGSCGATAGVARKPNNCSDLMCTPLTTDRGECGADIDTYCSGMLFANGKGVISCGVDSDCDAYISVGPPALDPDNWVCPGNDCGTCTVSTFRSCFNDPMSVVGDADPVNPILAGTFCLPPSSNGSVNNATGSPGPGTVQTDAIVTLRY